MLHGTKNNCKRIKKIGGFIMNVLPKNLRFHVINNYVTRIIILRSIEKFSFKHMQLTKHPKQAYVHGAFLHQPTEKVTSDTLHSLTAVQNVPRYQTQELLWCLRLKNCLNPLRQQNQCIIDHLITHAKKDKKASNSA